MASIRKIKSGWQAQVARRGVRTSKTFPTKRQAQDWAAREEQLILSGEGKYDGGTVSDLLGRYARTVSPKKRGERWEVLRLNNMARDELGAVRIKDLDPADIAAWRDRRLKQVAPNSVRREMQILNAVLNVAVKEWGALPRNPARDVSKPPKPQPRSRLVTDAEIAKLVARAPDLNTIAGRSVHAFRFACATAMRASELLSLDASSVNGSVATLQTSKTGKGRRVPLSSHARDLWAALPGDGFDLTPRQLDANFRKVRDACKITGLTFHDSRHRAITDLARKVSVLDLARIVGHDNLSQLMTYYEAQAEDIATLLD
ncbi:MAG: site-specific integrase [Pseudomonadota bacterium]